LIELVGISGKAGSGKDFVGRTLLRPAGYSQWAFAWPMKMLCVGRGYDYADVFHVKPPEVRRALQLIGTEEGWMKFGKDYWVDQAHAWMLTLHENLGINKFYLTDVRFQHEADFVKRLGGKLLRLEHGDRSYPIAGTEAAEHTSETALDEYDGWDARIVNNMRTTPDDMRKVLVAAGVLARYSPTEEG
jgi:hypothetical protein